MRPQDVDKLRELKTIAELAQDAALEFEVQAGALPESNERLEVRQRFLALRGAIIEQIARESAVITRRVGERIPGYASSVYPGTRAINEAIVIVGSESYHLRLRLTDYAGWEGIRAEWERVREREGKSPVPEYHYTEQFSEEWFSVFSELDEGKLRSLANLETSFAAYLEAYIEPEV